MKNESGKTPLGWLITIIISLIVVGVVVAMLFVDNQEFSNKIKENQNRNSNRHIQASICL